MILLLSEKNDITTNNIIDWLMFYDIKYIRINKGDNIELVNIHIDNTTTSVELRCRGLDFNLNEITGYWLRRSYFTYSFADCNINNNGPDPILSYLYDEFSHIRHFLHYKFEAKCRKVISNYNTITANKMQILDLAVSCGLTVPESLITNNRQQIINFIKKHPQVIVKSINNAIELKYNNENYIQYTSLLEDIDLESLPSNIFPCILQPLVFKKYEVRTFYFNDKFYSMAIFSQKNKQTQIDMRKYDWTNPNRATPYKLPLEVETKLKLLHERLNLQTASTDFIVSKDGKLLFLEINPIGQFGMVSHPCNYNLEKIVAKYLIEYEK